MLKPLPKSVARIGGLLVILLVACACSHPRGKPAAGTAPTPVAAASAEATPAPTSATSTAPAASASPPSRTATGAAQAGDEVWARQALKILDTVDSAFSDYHNATTYAPYTLMYQQLQQQAFAGFGRALAENDALWPTTQRVKDAAVRDQYVFVMGNIGGFLHPTPDLPGDPAGPTLGDRIARSLQNAVTTAALVRPKLQRLAGNP